MKPLNREEVLHKEGNGTPSNKSVIHKPSKKAKEEIFGGGKPTIYGKKKSPRKVKKDKKNKKKVAGLPLGAKIGAGVAGVAVVGGSVAALVHNMGGTKNDVQNANRHSKDTGLDFGTNKDDNDKSDLESHKSSRKKNDAKHNKHEKKSKGEDALDDLLGGDSDSSSDDSSSKSSKSKHSDDSDDTIEYSSSDKSLKALAEKATKSVSQANKLGGKEASKAVKGKSEPSKLPNAKENQDEKTNKNGLTALAYKPGQKQDDQLDAKINDLVARTNTQRENNGKGRVTENVNNGGNKGNTGTATARPNNNGNTGKPSNPLHNNSGDVVVKPDNPGHQTNPDNPSHETKPNNPGHQTNPDNPSHETKPNNPGHQTNPDNPGHQTNPDNPTTPTYPYQSVPDGTSKTVTFVDVSGKKIGTGTLTKNGNNVSLSDIPSGYKLADEDTEGHSAQLLQWPDTINVVSDGTNQPSTPTYPFQNVADGTTKGVTFVDADGKQVGTGTLTKNGNNVSVDGIPGGYKLSDLDTEGHSAQLLQWPDTISVVSDGTSQPSKPDNPTYPAQSIPDGTSKQVQFVTSDGTVIGTGTLSKAGNSVQISDIPGGYKLSDLDADGHSAQLLQWPNSITVVSDGSSVQPGGSTNSDQPSTPTYPFQSVPDGTSKTVAFVDGSGNQVGTGTLTKNGSSVHLSGIPGGYKLSDEDSQGHSAQLYQWPNSITVVSDGSSVQPSGNTNPDQSANPTYPAQSIPDGTSKQVQFVTSDGTVVGTGTLTKRNGGVAVDGIPGGYQMTDLDSQGHSMQLWNWPDKLTVMSVNSLDVAKYIHA